MMMIRTYIQVRSISGSPHFRTYYYQDHLILDTSHFGTSSFQDFFEDFLRTFLSRDCLFRERLRVGLRTAPFEVHLKESLLKGSFNTRAVRCMDRPI